MSITIVKDILSQEEIERIHQTVSVGEPYFDKKLGRLQINDASNSLSEKTVYKLTNIVKDIIDLPLQVKGTSYVEYNSLYGKPNLPPHLDADSSDLIINIQIESNTHWDIGLNFETYRLEDNSALIFNPNEEIHWRVHKEFKDGEYVKMLFVRLINSKNRSDYSHFDLRQNDEMFKDTVQFRDSLGVF